MRKRKYLIGATLALAVAIAMPSFASAAPNSQTLSVSVGKSKQEKKKRGAADIDVTVDTQYTFPTPAQTAQNTVVDFDNDFRFNPGKLPNCNPTALVNTTTDQAKAACSGSDVGAGAATLVGLAGAPVVGAIVTAFNGTPVGGNPQLLLHTRSTANTTTVLDGTLINSPLGGEYGKRLNVNVPDTGSTLGQTLVHFQTAVPRQVTAKKKKKNKKTGKKQVIKTYYVSARCSDKSWQFEETTLFRAGGGTQNAKAEVACKQKKKKKKK